MINHKMIAPVGSKTIQLWLGEVLLITSRKQLREFIKTNELEGSVFDNANCGANGTFTQMEGPDGITYFVMCLYKREQRLIVHESVHAAQFILEYKGIPIGSENTEVMAYMVENIYTLVNKALRMK